MAKRKMREPALMNCPVCGKEVLIPIGGERKCCSRECSGEMRMQVQHIERYVASELSAYVLARAYVYRRKMKRRGGL